MEINDELIEGTLEEVGGENKDSISTLEKNESVSMQENFIDDKIHAVTESLHQVEKSKGENIYVENDISGLERMLGISATKNKEDDEQDDDLEEADEQDNDLEEVDDLEDEEKNDNEYDVVSSDNLVISDENEEGNEEEKELENSKEKQVDVTMKDSNTIKSSQVDTTMENKVLLSDFMDIDKDSFTFLERCVDGYSLSTIPLEDKKEIKKAVRSQNYIFRYPRMILRDFVLGYKETVKEKEIYYRVFFPDYELSFSVPDEYVKPYSQSFKEYFEDLVSRIRPSQLTIKYFSKSVVISSLKVLETGLLEVSTDMGTEKYLLKNRNVNFYSVLDYIRIISDQGSDHIELKIIPAYFEEL